MSKPLVLCLLATACGSQLHHHDPDVDGGISGVFPPACIPGVATCTGGAVETCDDGGGVVTTPCALGCSADATHCLAPVPSNDLAAAIVLLPTADLALGSGVLDVEASTFQPLGGGPAIAVPSVELAAAPGGAPIRVFAGGAVTLSGTLIVANGAVLDGVGPAVAFAATGPLSV